MLKFADLLEANAERFAKLESMCMGQPVSLAKKMILGPVALWRYYAGYAGIQDRAVRASGCLCWYLRLEWKSRSRGVEARACHGGWQYFCVKEQ